MKFSWVPVSIVRQNMCQLLCLGLLGTTVLSLGDVAGSLHANHSRRQFPKQEGVAENPKDDRNQFPIQRRGSGTHWQSQPSTVDV